MAVTKRLLRHFRFFQPLADDELSALASRVRRVHYPAHATIFTDQQRGDRFYLLETGSVEIVKPTADGTVLLNVIQPGDHFGEMSLLDGKPRSAAARAVTNVTVLEISKADFLALVQRFPLLLVQAGRVSDERLRQRDLSLIAELSLHNQQLAQLYDTSLDISRHRELDAALSAIVTRATALLASSTGKLFLFDESARQLAARSGERVQPGVGTVGRAFVRNEPAIQNRAPRELAAPICLDAKPRGVLTVYRSAARAAFTPDEARLLLLFANQAAIAIENARLYALAVEKSRLDGELEAARQVQRRLIPARAPRVPGFRLAGLWRPAREVAGDFYDFVPRADGKWGIVIADVSDKGAPAALFMAMARSVLRASVTLEPDLAQAMARANRLLTADAADGMFVTVFLGILDPRARQFVYVNAGHNPPLWWHARTRRLERVTAHGLALGIDAAQTYAERQVEWGAGDLLVLYTDGVTDAINPRDQFFGDARLTRLVKANARADAATMIRALDRAVREFVGTQPLLDDVTAVALSVAR